MPNKRANTRNGREIQKIQCQFKCSNTSPENVGPIAGANMMTSPIVPIAAPRLCGGKMTRIVLNISGSSSPVPKACTILAAKRNGKDGRRSDM